MTCISNILLYYIKNPQRYIYELYYIDFFVKLQMSYMHVLQFCVCTLYTFERTYIYV